MRVFKNGTIRCMVDVNPPGLDAKGLLDLWTRVAAVVYSLTGQHIAMEEILIDDMKEFNTDSRDPELRQMLHLSGVKSAMSYSSLLESYLRIYEKTEGTVRVETGGRNALQLWRSLMRPVMVEEELARMPTEIAANLNQTRDEINQQITVLSQGMANTLQQQHRDHELTTHLTAVFTELLAEIKGFIRELREEREDRRQRETKLNDTVEILLLDHAIRDRLDEPQPKT